MRGIASGRRLVTLAALLIGVDFLDELSSGIPFVSTPELQADFDLSYGQAAGWLLAAMALLAVWIEAPLFVLADRGSRRAFVCGGLATLGLVCGLAAWAPSYGVLLFAMLLFGPANGVGVNLAQATLMDAHPDDRDRMMVRWTFAGALGDLATPGFLALCGFLGGGWRLGFAVVGAILLFYALLLSRRAFPERPPAAPGAPAPGGLDAVRAALRNRTFLGWGAATLLCDLMDEILVAFGALYLRESTGTSLETRAAILTALMAGGALGLPVAELLLRRMEARHLLGLAALGAGACFVLWLGAASPFTAGLWLGATGFFAAMHYPLAMAQTYRALPDGSGTVNAFLTAASLAMIPVPILLGLVADGIGLRAALLLLLLQPLGLLLAVVLLRDGSAAREPPGV